MKKKKTIMILGATGMAGHTIFRYLYSLNKYELINTARQKLNKDTLIIDVVRDINRLIRVIENSQPDIIINCVGVLIKESEKDSFNACIINGMFPHVLVDITKNMKTKIIHLSTECVFSGLLGKYFETEEPNEINVYGKTKAMGEIIDTKNLTLRLGFIGDELKENGSGLFEWFMRQEREIKGYINAIWNGITCLELAKQIDKIIDTNLTGLYHLTSDSNISKFALLKKIAKIFNKEIVIKASHRGKQNKTLINNRKKEYDPKIPDYETQLIEMKRFMWDCSCKKIHPELYDGGTIYCSGCGKAKRYGTIFSY